MSQRSQHYLEDNNKNNSRNKKKQQVFNKPCTPVNPVSQAHHLHGFFQTILFLENQFLTISQIKTKSVANIIWQTTEITALTMFYKIIVSDNYILK